MKPTHHQKPRARDLGIPFAGEPGPWNAITDVAGVEVGHKTLSWGEGPLVVGKGPVRTGVTAILPRGKRYDPPFAAWFSFNGNGEMTGTTWVEESGLLESPILFTNSHSVGVVRDAVIAWQMQHRLLDEISPGTAWLLPVVGETYDGTLNDINGQHVRAEHVEETLDTATTGPVLEGCVGGGMGMICHGFKGGIGTASRKVQVAGKEFTLGVLVQANHGRREDLTVAGIPVGMMLSDIPNPRAPARPPAGTGSILAAVATDAPLLPHQLKRLARRVPMGLARVGSHGEHYSGDIFIAFSTANPGVAGREGIHTLQMLSMDRMDPLMRAAVQATEEAILNALLAAETTVGINGTTAHALPHDRVRDIVKGWSTASNPQT